MFEDVSGKSMLWPQLFFYTGATKAMPKFLIAIRICGIFATIAVLLGTNRVLLYLKTKAPNILQLSG